VALVVAGLVATLLVVRVLASAGSETSGLPDCPTARPTAEVATFSPTVVVAPDPLAGTTTTVYRLDVDFVVTNDTPVPIHVSSIEADVISEPDATVVAYGPSSEAVAPGEAITVGGSADVVQEGLAEPPVPDAGTVRLTANWADDDYTHCEI
jgi:hypothetical protein